MTAYFYLFLLATEESSSPSVRNKRPKPHWCEPDDPLMESWDSLTKFNQCQRGRISNMGWREIFSTSLFSVSPVRHPSPFDAPLHRPSLILTTPRTTLATPMRTSRSRCSSRVATSSLTFCPRGATVTTSASTVSRCFPPAVSQSHRSISRPTHRISISCRPTGKTHESLLTW